MSGTEKIVDRSARFRRHRHGGKRIPNFVRPEEADERKRRPAVWFGSVQELFGRRKQR